jgi:hypothetical protein
LVFINDLQIFFAELGVISKAQAVECVPQTDSHIIQKVDEDVTLLFICVFRAKLSRMCQAFYAA